MKCPRVLHVLSQRPSRTGSGITLDSIVRLAEARGWEQGAVVGVPFADHEFSVGRLTAERLFPVRFGHPDASLPFPVPGMSDVMPYSSSIWSRLTDEQLADYRRVWLDHLTAVLRDFKPDLIHSHHIWLVSSLLKDLAFDIPVVTTCHSTGLRQMELTPHLRKEVIAGCRRIDHFVALREDHAQTLANILEVNPTRITVCGAGYREDLFRPEPSSPQGQDLIYVGKFSRAKGLPWLLDAFEKLLPTRPNLTLNIAGDGAGPEAEDLRARMRTMAPNVVMHGLLNQQQLAALMGRCALLVLPSFYEGVPLVLVEAAACGCRILSTDLPGVRDQIAPYLGDGLETVPLPRLRGMDVPEADDLPKFVAQLGAGLSSSLAKNGRPTPDLSRYTWGAVFERVERIWKDLLTNQTPSGD